MQRAGTTIAAILHIGDGRLFEGHAVACGTWCSWRNLVYEKSFVRQGAIAQPHANIHTPLPTLPGETGLQLVSSELFHTPLPFPIFSHIAREPRHRKLMLPLFCTVEFVLRLAGQKRVARYGLHGRIVGQSPHLHQIPCATNGGGIDVDSITTKTLGVANRYPSPYAGTLLSAWSAIRAPKPKT